MKKPEYRRIYSLSDFRMAWFGENCNALDIIPVYLPTKTTLKEPQYFIPFAARVYRTPFLLVRGELHWREELPEMEREQLSKTGNGESVVLAELWQHETGEQGYALRGYIFLSELEFIGDPEFSVDYDWVSRSTGYSNGGKDQLHD